MYGKEEADPQLLDPVDWELNLAYLEGIDLYHQGYLWEAHEAWEGIWQVTDKVGTEALFLQGLIQIAVAQLHLYMDNLRGAIDLSRKGHGKLHDVAQTLADKGEQSFMGVQVQELVTGVEQFFGPLWADESPPTVSPPRLRLTGKP